MGEREAMREREAEPKQRDLYEELFRIVKENMTRANTGKVVIRGKDQPWEQAKQGKLKHFCHPDIKDTAADGWLFFLHEIRTQSGRHRHQGGLAIYVVDGKGYTTVNGERVDWEEGDLILLPIMPNGVEHQHFNTDPEKPSRWLAFIPYFLTERLGQYTTQVEVSPDWEKIKGRDEARH